MTAAISATAGTPGQAGGATVEMIKLVVWDLDDTFWRGTLAEDGEVRIPEENVAALEELTDRGIVNAICSKNHHDRARAVLEERGLWEYFVFPRIAFAPKGEAVRQLIADMGLRAANVLFVDDNTTNLAEVEFYNPGIRVLDAAELSTLLTIPGIEGKPDPGHTRLRHYQLLERRNEAQGRATSNEDFLRSSELRIELTPSRPEDAPRIHDMVMRTNQLNFTKQRISLAEVEELLADPAGRSGTVRVRDRFGDYGVVGWYYLRAGRLEHYLFSCRTINLGIEQHLYAYLGHPRLEIVGETAAEVGPADRLRDYITLDELTAAAATVAPGSPALIADEDRLRVFVMSACDLFQAMGKLALPLVDLRFECNTFRGRQRGVNVGTEYVRSCVEMTEDDKQYCRENFLNYQGSTAFATQIFAQPYDYVVLSCHDDLTYEQYRHRSRRGLVVQLDLPLRRLLRALPTPPPLEPLIVSRETEEAPALGEPGEAWFGEEFESEGLITPERFAENLEWILGRLHPRTELLLATAPEMPYFRSYAPDLSYVRDRAIVLNRVIRDFCATHERAHLVELNDVIHDRAHVTDYVMHLTPERGHAVSQLILEQMAAHPSGRVPRRERLGIGDRSVVLWETNPERALAVAPVMRAAGIAPDGLAIPGWTGERAMDGEGIAATATGRLNGRRDDCFVVAVQESDDTWLEPTLEFYGYRPGRDFATVSPWVFAPDWNEGVA